MKESCNPAKGSFFSPYALIRKQKPKKSVVNVVIVVFCGSTYCFSMVCFFIINCCTALYLLQKKKNYNKLQPSTTFEFQRNKLKNRYLQQIQQKQLKLMLPFWESALIQVSTKPTITNTFAR